MFLLWVVWWGVLRKTLLLRRETAPLLVWKRKNTFPFVAVWLLLRDFSFGGVTSVDVISSHCFFEQLPEITFWPQVGSRVSLLWHALPSLGRLRLLPQLNSKLHWGVVIGQSWFYTSPLTETNEPRCSVGIAWFSLSYRSTAKLGSQVPQSTKWERLMHIVIVWLGKEAQKNHLTQGKWFDKLKLLRFKAISN